MADLSKQIKSGRIIQIKKNTINSLNINYKDFNYILFKFFNNIESNDSNIYTYRQLFQNNNNLIYSFFVVNNIRAQIALRSILYGKTAFFNILFLIFLRVIKNIKGPNNLFYLLVSIITNFKIVF
jgi:hypothetical protein